MVTFGNSLVVQWLRFYAFIAKSIGSIPGKGTKIPQAKQCSQYIYIIYTHTHTYINFHKLMYKINVIIMENLRGFFLNFTYPKIHLEK